MVSARAGSRPLDVRGATLASWLPVGVQHVSLCSGLTALYGKNGTGKTRLLTDLAAMLGAKSTWREDLPPSERFWNDPWPSWAFYSAGGIHLSYPMDARQLLEPSSSEAQSPLESAAAEWLRCNPFEREVSPWVNDDGSETKIPPQPTALARLGLDDDALNWFLAQGAWFLQPQTGWVYLCDPDPLGQSPLRDAWIDHSSRWSSWFEADRNDPERQNLGTRLGSLASHDDDEMAHIAQFADQGLWTHPGMSTPPPSFVSGPLDLMPLPETLGLDPSPSWVGLPVVALDRRMRWSASVISDGLPSTSSDEDTTWGRLTDLTINKLPQYLDRAAVQRFERLRADSPAASKLWPERVHFDDALAQVAVLANNVLADMFDDPPVLRCSRSPESAWLKGRPPIEWQANVAPNGSWFSPNDLGEAHRRYAGFAIERALELWNHRNRRSRSTPTQARRRGAPGHEGQMIDGGTFALIDEPERALHPAAEHRLAQVASTLGERVVVSTHSSEFLDAGFRSGAVVRVERSGRDVMRLHEESLRLEPSLRRQLADEWGLTPARLAAMVRVFVFVEGPHDQRVVSAMLRTELEQAGAVVMPLLGTESLHMVALTEFMFASSEAPVVVCLDNSSAGVLREAQADLAKSPGAAAKLGRLRRRETQARWKRPEMQAALELLKAAVRTHREDRLALFGFSKRDIAEYLPAGKIHPGYTSWAELDRAFREQFGRERFQPGDGIRKKQWVTETGGRYHTHGIEQVIKELEAEEALERHHDFLKLGDLLRQLSFESTRSRGAQTA